MKVLDRMLQRPVTQRQDLRFRSLSLADIDDVARALWRDLLCRSCHQNPFLAPEFVLPAGRWLSPDQQHLLFIVESRTADRWLAAAMTSVNQVSQALPWSHLVTSHSRYTSRSGLLVDADCTAHALDVLLLGMTSGGWKRQTLEIPGLRVDSTLTRELAAAALRLNFAWQTTTPRNVPAAFPEIVSEEYLAERWSVGRRKSLRRSKAKLKAGAPVQLRLRTEPGEVADALETFLKFEHDSWKGDAGTSCKANPQDEAFIREMVTGMAGQNRVILSELCAGDEVVASAINLVAGTALFAFKIGWNKAWAAASPGVLHEAQLLLATRGPLQNFTLFDSCSAEGSYLAPIWPERIPVATGILCASQWSRLSHQAMQALRRLRRWLVTRSKTPLDSNIQLPDEQP